MKNILTWILLLDVCSYEAVSCVVFFQRNLLPLSLMSMERLLRLYRQAGRPLYLWDRKKGLILVHY
jgi:hypothetical protein